MVDGFWDKECIRIGVELRNGEGVRRSVRVGFCNKMEFRLVFYDSLGLSSL